MTTPDAPEDARVETTCHATCLVLGEDGILLRGAAGAGKSSLCLELLDEAEQGGRHARLVGDDRVCLRRYHDRLVARPHRAVEGLIEIRGLGIRSYPNVASSAVVRLVVDLVDECPRMPADSSDATLLTVRLPHLVLARRQPRAYLVRHVLAAPRRSRARENVASRSQSPPEWTAAGVAP